MKTFFRRTTGVWIAVAVLAAITGCMLDLSALPVGNGKVALMWDSNPEPDVKGYKLYYGFESGNYVGVKDVGNVTSYTLSGLQNGSEYFFALTAYNDAGESAYSDEISYTVPEIEIVNSDDETE